ncbi:hypothetical protein B296_00021270 [Ensete ventricosum]|uniref:Transposase (putative) gypsy type domain-containing protein n=1 Tax=Ensete ventricosum TaxID=4639 RepID=A0A426YI12_ENSVE|nr:hypothetical protein B296_00021270 [Ensete ventricosum]
MAWFRPCAQVCPCQSGRDWEARERSAGLARNVPRLGLLGSAPRAPPSRGLPRDPARRPRRGGGARCDPSDDQVSALIEMVLRVQYIELDPREPLELFSRVAFIPTSLAAAAPVSLMLEASSTDSIVRHHISHYCFLWPRRFLYRKTLGRFKTEEVNVDIVFFCSGRVEMFQLGSAVGSCKKVRGFYSNGYGAPVPEVLTAPVAYHVVVLRRGFRGPRGVISGVNSGDLAEKVTSGTNLEDLAEELISGTNPGDFVEELIFGTNPGDSAEKVISGINLGDLAEEPISGANPGDFAEELISGTNPEDLAEKVTSGGDLAEEPISGTNPGDFVEGLISGTNLVDLVEEPISDTNLGDLVEKVTSGTNPGDLAEGLFASRSLFEQVGMTSSDSSSSVRVISSPRSGGVSQSDPEASSSGASLGPLSPIDSRALEVMKADHDLDTAVTEGSLAVIRERYSIPTEYGLHVPQPGQRPFSSDAPDMCISVDALEVGLRFPLHPLIEESLKWWRISPSQVAPNSWHYLVVFLGQCRGAGIILTRDLFMACFCLCKNRGGCYLITRVGFRVSGAPSNNKGWKSRYLFVSDPVWGFRLDWSTHPIGNAPPPVLIRGGICPGRQIEGNPFLFTRDQGDDRALADRMDLGELRGMHKVSGGKAPSTCTAAPAREVDDPARRPKKVKVLTRRHKSRHGEGETHSRSKGKEPAAPSEELETPVESDEGGASSVHHCPRSMKDLFKTKVHKDDAGYYTLHISDLGHQDPDKEMKARWRGLKNSTKIWNDSSAAEEFERGLLHPQLAWELYTLPSEVLLARATKEMVPLDALKSGGGPEAVAKAEERASELEQELRKTKQERDGALQRLEASEVVCRSRKRTQAWPGRPLVNSRHGALW